jgi:hypothetical protein
MFLSSAPALAFVHVPRTGGTSVEDALCNALGRSVLETYHHPLLVSTPQTIEPPLDRWARHPDRNGLINCKHATARQMRARTGDAFWESATTFTILRHPLDRLVSVFCIYSQADIYSGHPFRRFADFRAFRDALRDGTCKPPDIDRQFQMVTNESGSLLVKHVLRFERLEKDFRRLCESAGLRDVKIPHINRSRRENWQSLFDPPDVRMLFGIYRKDFDVCGISLKDLLA